MKRTTTHINRYAVPSDEDFEPDSNQEVLKNFLGIKKREEIEAIEFENLEHAELELVNLFDSHHQFTAQDICNIHELWLGDIYSFAGRYRTVTMSKDGFPFAAPNCIASAMETFEKNYLTKYTPCNFTDEDELALALGITHVELILIHPFREGNGRTARMLADLMAMQSNKPPLKFAYINRIVNLAGFEDYIGAIHAGVAQEYRPIQEIFKKLLAN